MPGYPYHNVGYDEPDVNFSDILKTRNVRLFMFGFIAGALYRVKPAYAEEVKQYIPQVAPAPAPAPANPPQNVPTIAKAIQWSVLGGACTAAVAAAACLVMAGWCLGRSFDRVIAAKFG
jgi:hypothetical protein